MGNHLGRILDCLGLENYEELQPGAHHTRSSIRPPSNYTFNNLYHAPSSLSTISRPATFRSFNDSGAWCHDLLSRPNKHSHVRPFRSCIESEGGFNKLGSSSNKFSGLGREEKPVACVTRRNVLTIGTIEIKEDFNKLGSPSNKAGPSREERPHTIRRNVPAIDTKETEGVLNKLGSASNKTGSGEKESPLIPITRGNASAVDTKETKGAFNKLGSSSNKADCSRKESLKLDDARGSVSAIDTKETKQVLNKIGSPSSKTHHSRRESTKLHVTRRSVLAIDTNETEGTLDKLGSQGNKSSPGRKDRLAVHVPRGNVSAIDTKEANEGAHAIGVGNPRRTAISKERRLGPYTASQKILLVGEGDFSFSASLARAFGSATNMLATSFDSWEFLSRNYGEVQSNILQLAGKGCTIMHDITATKMANHYLLGCMKFDRIIFNFPYAGFHDEPRQIKLRRHRKLVSLFLANAKKMIEENGEIHITHKSNGFHKEWNIPQLGWNEGLWLLEEVPFNYKDYPGYHTKYGFGGDKNFNSNPSETYKFTIMPRRSLVYCDSS